MEWVEGLGSLMKEKIRSILRLVSGLATWTGIDWPFEMMSLKTQVARHSGLPTSNVVSGDRCGVCVALTAAIACLPTSWSGPGSYVGRENVEKHLPLQSKVLTDADAE